MRDPLEYAADAMVALGLTPPAVSPAPAEFQWQDFAALEELEEVVATHVRLRRSAAGPIEVPHELMRRARLRFELGIGERRPLEHGGEYVHLRTCSRTEPDSWLRPLMRRCRCVEDAVVEVAAERLVVDESAIVEVRRRAALRHGRLVRRLEAARVRARVRRREEGAPSSVSIVERAKPDLFLEGYVVDESYTSPVEEAEPVAVPLRRGPRVVGPASFAVLSGEQLRELDRRLLETASRAAWDE